MLARIYCFLEDMPAVVVIVVENVVATPVDTIRHASQRHFGLGGSIAARRA